MDRSSIKLYDKVLNKLNEFGITIYETTGKNTNDVIMAENLVISCYKNEEIVISFHVNSTPSYAARIILILKEIENTIFYIDSEFAIDTNGKYLDGEEATKYYENINKQNNISEFMEEQSQLYILSRSKSFNC